MKNICIFKKMFFVTALVSLASVSISFPKPSEPLMYTSEGIITFYDGVPLHNESKTLLDAFCLRKGPAEKIILTSGIIKLLDGVPFGFDGVMLGDMLHVRREVRKIQFGVQNPTTKAFEGIYSFNGQNHSLHTLAYYEKNWELELQEKKAQIESLHMNRVAYINDLEAIENSITKKYQEELHHAYQALAKKHVAEGDHDSERATIAIGIYKKYQKEFMAHDIELRKKHTTDKNALNTELSMLVAQHNDKLALLKPCIAQIKADFLEAILPFMEQARGVKPLVLTLIKESCFKRGRPDSFLLQWGKESEETEIAKFKDYMNTCQRLDTFCADLSNFMGDILNSCPKGWKQFLDLSAQSAHK